MCKVCDDDGLHCNYCGGNQRVAEIAKRMGHRPDIAFARVMKLEEALRKIVAWELPETGEYVDEEKTQKASYSFLYGSNGEREYMRSLAHTALEG